MHTHHLFVYGSLLSGFKSHAYDYIKRYFKLLGEASVTGTMYDLGTHPVAISKNTGRTIKGELYEIINPHELSFAIAQIDDHEGMYPEEGEEVFFEREAADIIFNGATITAWIYWYNRDVSDKPVVESGDMREYAKEKKQL